MKCPKCGTEHEVGFCPECGAPKAVICTGCQTEHSAKFCPGCGKSAPEYSTDASVPSPGNSASIQPESSAMPTIVINNTNTNTNTNTNVNANVGYMHPPKSKMVALILCILLGYLGAHHFYTGKTGMGIVYLLTVGLFGIGWIFDIVRILTGSFRDKWGIPLV